LQEQEGNRRKRGGQEKPADEKRAVLNTTVHPWTRAIIKNGWTRKKQGGEKLRGEGEYIDQLVMALYRLKVQLGGDVIAEGDVPGPPPDA
jgi:hypothetical protein